MHQLEQVILVKPSDLTEGFDLRRHIEHLEIAYINTALREAQGVVAKAAKMLGLRRTTLIEKMKRYQLQRYSTSSTA